jgi:protein-disulfide isomerase
MSARPLTNETVDRILTEHGVALTSLDRPEFLQAANDQLIRTRKLAVVLGVKGTPAFIVGDTMVPGDRMDSVRAAISAARARKG